MHPVLYKETQWTLGDSSGPHTVHIEPLLAHYEPGSLYRDTVHVEPLLAHNASISLYRDTVHIGPLTWFSHSAH